MASKKKTWAEKLAAAKAKMPEPHIFYCDKSKLRFVIPAVSEIEEMMRGVRKGKILTMKEMSDFFKNKHEVDMCCPMTTGIFAWIIAHAAYDAEQAGAKRVVPWWRTVKSGGELNPKYPGKGEIQRERLEAEGYRIVQKGKKLIVTGKA
ncbi:MAG TPA: MGMT family protein [Candidatus Hydrogenedentes bacterium]|nr:MGMT family protein [Candidatus Hydrogenedentota bacterium]